MGRTRQMLYVVSSEQWINNELSQFEVAGTFDKIEDAKLKAQSLIGTFENMLNEASTKYWLEFGVYGIILHVNNNRTIVSYAPEFIKV